MGQSDSLQLWPNACCYVKKMCSCANLTQKFEFSFVANIYRCSPDSHTLQAPLNWRSIETINDTITLSTSFNWLLINTTYTHICLCIYISFDCILFVCQILICSNGAAGFKEYTQHRDCNKAHSVVGWLVGCCHFQFYVEQSFLTSSLSKKKTKSSIEINPSLHTDDSIK